MARRDGAADRDFIKMKYEGTVYRSINTCKDCPDRYIACHDHCEKYQKALAEWKEKKAAIKHAKRMNRLYDGFKIEAMARIRS